MMRKLRNPKSASRTPIATSLLSTMNRKRILDDRGLPVPGTVHETPEPFQITVAGIQEFEGLHPSHAAYVYAHNVVSALAEKFTSWRDLTFAIERCPVCASQIGFARCQRRFT